MTDKERRASKYLPFDSLKGLKEQIELEDERAKNFIHPVLSEDEKAAMDFTLFDCYSRNKVITISYFENGSYKQYSGIIEKIDIINKQITLIPRKRFTIDSIYRIIAGD